MNTYSTLREDLDEIVLNSQIEFIFVCDYTQKEVNYYLDSGWDDLALLSIGHKNQESKPLSDLIMKRERHG